MQAPASALTRLKGRGRVAAGGTARHRNTPFRPHLDRRLLRLQLLLRTREHARQLLVAPALLLRRLRGGRAGTQGAAEELLCVAGQGQRLRSLFHKHTWSCS